MSKKFENRLRKIVRFTLGTIACLSFFFMIGSVGALEQDYISLRQGAVQCFGSMAVFGVSFYLVG